MAEHEERTLPHVALLAGATGVLGVALLLVAVARSAAAADRPCAELARVVTAAAERVDGTVLVECRGGSARLLGVVATEQDRTALLGRARQVRGLDELRDELTVRERERSAPLGPPVAPVLVSP